MICINVKSASQGGHENHQEGGRYNKKMHKTNARILKVSSITASRGARKIFNILCYRLVSKANALKHIS